MQWPSLNISFSFVSLYTKNNTKHHSKRFEMFFKLF